MSSFLPPGWKELSKVQAGYHVAGVREQSSVEPKRSYNASRRVNPEGGGSGGRQAGRRARQAQVSTEGRAGRVSMASRAAGMQQQQAYECTAGEDPAAPGRQANARVRGSAVAVRAVRARTRASAACGRWCACAVSEVTQAAECAGRMRA